MIPEPTVRATRYEVSCLPEGHIDVHHFTVAVEYRGDGQWAVCRHRQCLGTDGFWSWESIPSEREDEWIATHRFSLDEARALAKDAARKITCNGLTVADVLARDSS